MNTEIYSQNDFRSYELYHHGVLGQRWGRRNGPPYPLSPAAHSPAEKKAGWRDSLKADHATRRNVNESIRAAREESRIERLESKTPTERRQAKIEKLKKARNTRIRFLTDNEIELGRRYMKRNEAANTVMTLGAIATGNLGGMIAAEALFEVGYSFTKSGKESRELARTVREQGRTRYQDEKSKAQYVNDMDKANSLSVSSEEHDRLEREAEERRERTAPMTKEQRSQLDDINSKMKKLESKEDWTKEDSANYMKLNKQKSDLMVKVNKDIESAYSKRDQEMHQQFDKSLKESAQRNKEMKKEFAWLDTQEYLNKQVDKEMADFFETDSNGRRRIKPDKVDDYEDERNRIRDRIESTDPTYRKMVDDYMDEYEGARNWRK